MPQQEALGTPPGLTQAATTPLQRQSFRLAMEMMLNNRVAQAVQQLKTQGHELLKWWIYASERAALGMPDIYTKHDANEFFCIRRLNFFRAIGVRLRFCEHHEYPELDYAMGLKP